MKIRLRSRFSNGFTAVELVASLAICLIIGLIGTKAFISARAAKQLDTTTDSIAAKLEEAKGNSMTGKGSYGYGVKFNSSSYVFWNGSAYNPADANNITFSIPSRFTISNTIPGATDAIQFARITGSATATGTIYISDTEYSLSTTTIVVGDQGDISVIK